MGLARCQRLRGHRVFAALYQNHRHQRGQFFRLRYRPHPEGTGVQAAVVVSTKVSKKAVQRNRLKRQMRSVLRQLLPECTPGWQMVITAQPQALTGQYGDFLRELEQLLQRAGMIHGHPRRRDF
ncbi:ribonuclease P [Gloeomargarita lithophora Alchichica-D10]|uniref:Ribonuclease P protein component n=1 Tax=Gloeomargarita lithophora Alchichica-D10 TaxID=1188229 RepID=A0A1J0ABT9_9CYAN|nr:ribonuclease P protein component [Gloeomargarita lithophora]APB33412.1 ribonuclease P [Gloeomargarita lithophora Alchichica-D10]